MKCISGCKGFILDECNQAPRCSYVNGMTRKYCRLSSKYKMGPKPKCTIRNRKMNIKQEAVKKMVQNFKINKINSKSQIIKNFMLRTKSKRKSNYLKIVCSDSGVCIAFGTNSKKIVDFFDGFTTFNYVTNIKQIGEVSSNGFVKEIHYQRKGYNSYAVLKSSVRSRSDNLVYEFIAGQFINKLNNYYSCFVETYGLYYYKNLENWMHAKITPMISTPNLKKSLDLQTTVYDYKKMCEQSKLAAILIQHLKNASTIHSKMRDHSFIVNELAGVLYQIYMPLAQLSDRFTHYDLHSSNVLLYEPIQNKYIEYHYHLTNEVVRFKSRYIAKIIDYGRSYYHSTDPVIINPTDIYDNLCIEPSCDQDCGAEMGFQWFDDARSNFYINSKIANKSHDLRLLTILKPFLESANINIPLLNVLKKVVYGEGLVGTDRQYGTESSESGLPNHIKNVSDIEKELRTIIVDVPLQDKIGDLHIYTDGRIMEFIPI
jgi:hypothetical protein